MDENKVTYFAQTDARGKKVPFVIKRKDRTKHMYVIGKTRMGISTLVVNMAVQDIRNGEGFAFIDPHGKTAELLLEYIPKERMKDVVYFAPFDMEYPISFNVMEDVGYDKRHLVLSGLMSTFKKIWEDAWSARMEYILGNTVLALLEYPGATLLGVNRMLADKEYRKKVVDNITDPSVKSFWVDEFAKYTDKFAANPLIRNIIGQPDSSFDLRKMMDEKKILIVNLSKGRVGETNANLLGSMLITKIYLAALSRADIQESELKKLPNFYLYVDEFQSFANKSFADILSEARKYKLNLTIAHQYIEQMEEEVRAAVFGNVGTMVAFRVGAFDAEVLEKEFSPKFLLEDIVNLGFAQIYLKLMIDGISSAPFSATTLPPIAPPDKSFKQEVIESSRAQFSQQRNKIEGDIRDWHAPAKPVPKPPSSVAASVPTSSASTSPTVATSTPGASAPVTSARLVETVRPVHTAPAVAPAIAHPVHHPSSHATHTHSAKPVSHATHTNTPHVNHPPHHSSHPVAHHKQAPSPAPVAPAPMSLSQLKSTAPSSAEAKKAPLKEHISALRQALASVTREPLKDAPVKPQQAQKQTQPQAQPKKKKKTESKPKAEVPEDVLKKLLEIK